MKPGNLLLIMSDEHSRKVVGCYGHPMVRTPNMDRLAARGALFNNAYCNCPICVPSRASFATGRYVHEISYWDNAHPYEGAVAGWGHRLQESGHRVVSIGKLHYRDAADPAGFDEEIIPLHVVGGIGDLNQLVRDEMTPRASAKKMAYEAGAGETSYTAYDREITRRAAKWIREQARMWRDKPWVLFVSFVCPHFPLTAPEEFFDLYPPERLPRPKLYGKDERPDHPAIRDFATSSNYDDYFDEDYLKRAIAGYLGLVSFVDHNIGAVLEALEDAGLMGETHILYTSDHGDNLGARGLWGKSVMYEESVGVPLIMAGPEVPAGRVCDTPVSLVDCYPTILEAVGEGGIARADASDRPGRPLLAIAEGAERGRAVFSEYHAVSSRTGHFMVRDGRHKLVHYPGYRPQLFDLSADPEELRDLGDDPAGAEARRTMEAKLRAICDPDEVDRRAKADQGAKIAAFGGKEEIRKRKWGGYSPPPEGFENAP